MDEQLNQPSQVNLSIDPSTFLQAQQMFAGQELQQLQGGDGQSLQGLENPAASQQTQPQQEEYIPTPAEDTVVTPEAPKAPPAWGTEEWADLAKSPIRGVLAAAQSAYELADWATADILPNIDMRVLGEGHTEAGKIVEGITQFVAGFALTGLAGKALGGVKVLSGLAGAMENPLLGGAVKGAITDFTFMDAHQARLSDLVQSVPQLQNPVSEFLAGDVGESEFMGRLKNAVEGVMVGAAVDGVIHLIGTGVKAFKVASEARLAGKTPQEVADASAKVAEDGIVQAEAKVSATDQAVKDVKATVDGATNTDKANIELQAKVEAYVKASNDGNTGLTAIDLADALKKADEVGGVKGMQKALKQVAEDVLGTRAIEKTTSADMVKEASENFKFRSDEDMAGISSPATKEEAQSIYLQNNMMGHILKDSSESYVQKIMKGTATAADAQAFAEEFKMHMSWFYHYQRQGTESARILQLRNGSVSSKEMGKQLAEDAAKKDAYEQSIVNFKQFNSTDPEQRRLLDALAKQLSVTDPRRVMDVMGKSMSPQGKIMNAAASTYTAGLLSFQSVGADAVSSFMNTMIRPFRVWVGSLGRSGGADGVTRAMAEQYAQLPSMFKYSWDMFTRTLKTEAAPFGASSTQMDAGVWNPLIDASKRPIASNVEYFAKRTLGAVGSVLMSTESFNKALAAQLEIAGRLTLEAEEKGLQGSALSKYVSDGIGQMLSKDGLVNSEAAIMKKWHQEAEKQGMTGVKKISFAVENAQKEWKAKDANIANAAIDAGREATFTRDFDTGTPLGDLSKSISAFAHKHPVARFFVPFIKTPSDILRTIAEHTPIVGSSEKILGVKNPFVRQALEELKSADPIVKANAEGRLRIGTMMWTIAGVLSANGTVTGRGPNNSNERRQLMATGWQPYSIKVGDKYYSYARVEPLASFWGIASDAAFALQRGKADNEPMMDRAFSAAILPLLSNLKNKTFLKGVTDISNLLSIDEATAERVIRDKVASIIPNSLKSMGMFGDSYWTMGQPKSSAEAFQSRIPWMMDGVGRQRNVLGEVVDAKPEMGRRQLGFINPVTITQDQNDPVMREIASLEHGFAMPPSKRAKSIDLTQYKNSEGQSAYDRWQELTSTTTIGGKTIRAEMSKLIRSSKYQSLSNVQDVDYNSPRVTELNRVITRYRDSAWKKLMSEYPDMAKAYTRKIQQDSSLKRGASYSSVIASI